MAAVAQHGTQSAAATNRATTPTAAGVHRVDISHGEFGPRRIDTTTTLLPPLPRTTAPLMMMMPTRIAAVRTDDDERLAYHTLPPVTSFGHESDVMFLFQVIVLYFHYAFIMLHYASIMLHYASIMLSLCFHYAFIMLF